MTITAKLGSDRLAAAPAVARSHASKGRLRPPAIEPLGADGAGPPAAKWLHAHANRRPENPSVAE